MRVRTINQRRAAVAVLATVALAASLGAAPAAVAAASVEAPAVTNTFVRAAGTGKVMLKDPKVRGKACKGAKGVTVVVDFRNLRNARGKKMNVVKIGCARGAQESGFTALLGAGFDVDPTQAFVCMIDHRPIDPPTCPPPDGFWSYSHGKRGGQWESSGVGAGGWQPPKGSLEGWSWAPYDRMDWGLPRVTPADLFPPAAA
jgi:hypothetical protein